MKYEKRSVCFHFYKRFNGNQITMENLSLSSSKEVEMKEIPFEHPIQVLLLLQSHIV